MGKIIETRINRFDGGMTLDKRDPDTSKAQLIKHFDYTKGYSLVPFRGSEGITTIAGTTEALAQLKLFLMYGSTQYALGVVDSTNKAKIYYNSNTIADPTWGAVGSGEDGTAGVNNGLFKEYKGLIWGDAGGTRLWSYNIGTPGFTSSAQAVTYTSITQALIHSKDDFLYFGYTNSTGTFIASKNGAGAWNLTALTLPTNLKVVSICEYGNYLAIACAPVQVGQNSKVFLWDRDSSRTTISEIIDLGSRVISLLENLDGYLIAVSISGNTSAVLTPHMVFSRYNGGGFTDFERIALASGVNSISYKQKINNRIYFALNGASLSGTVFDYTGIWSVGRSKATDPFSVAFSYLANNNTYPNGITGFLIVDDYVYISSTAQTTNTVTLTKTNDSASYTANSTYESQIFNLGDGGMTKKLIGASVMFESLPANGSVKLSYKKDGETSFTEIFTHTTDSTMEHSAINIESSGATLPTYKEMQFQIISTGGAVITGLKFKSEVIDDQKY